MLDLSDVYITVFLPTEQVGKIAIGAQGRIVLDALPKLVIPAQVSFVSPTSQFTPKTVETKSERDKLMFRVKVRVDRGGASQRLRDAKRYGVACGGEKNQAIGRSRGGWTTKIHVLTNQQGAPIAVEITAGQVSDSRMAEVLLGRVAPSAFFLGDGAYDTDALRLFLLDRSTVAAIPSHPRRATPIPCDETAYKGRNVVERTFSHLKDWRRVATRYDKLKETFQSAVVIAILCTWWAN